MSSKLTHKYKTNCYIILRYFRFSLNAFESSLLCSKKQTAEGQWRRENPEP
jgi:hypothetical protein